jgi:hypothetical protein
MCRILAVWALAPVLRPSVTKTEVITQTADFKNAHFTTSTLPRTVITNDLQSAPNRSSLLNENAVSDRGENADQLDCDLLDQLRATPELIEHVCTSTESDMRMQAQLRKEHSAELVRSALLLRDSRRRAAAKFSKADAMWFDPVGLEQATSEPVARYKAKRFSGEVADWCCGVGMDSIALADHGCRVSSVDWRSANCTRTLWNAEAYGVSDRITTSAADVRDAATTASLVHIDPDRRSKTGQRFMRVEDCEPNLEFLLEMIPRFSGGAIKLSPASNFGGKFIDGPVEIELVSLKGECKEATIWFGELAGESPFRATALHGSVLGGEYQTTSIAADPLSAWTQVKPLGAYIYDPDPAIVRSGLVDVLAEQLELWRLDDAEEYLTGDQLVSSPFLQSFQVSENLPNNDKEIRRAIRVGGYGQVEIKCRHIPIKAELVRKKLPLTGTSPVTLIYTRQEGKARAVICHRTQDD